MTSVMLPENSVSLYQGQSKTLEVAVVDLSDKPVDLTGSTIFFTVKQCYDQSHGLIIKTSNNIAEAEIVNAKGGIARIYLQPADTFGLAEGQYKFDVWVELVTGKRYPVILPSVFEVVAGVTKIPV